MSYAERLRALALGFPGAVEEHPWGEEPVFKAANRKIFVFGGADQPDGSCGMTVKLTPEEGVEALALPFVERARYVGRYGWVTARVSNDFEWEVAEGFVRRSYELVTATSKRKRARLGQPG